MTVTVPVTEVTLNTNSLELKTDTTGELKATINPLDATNKIVTWSSSKASVATVDEKGIVTAKSTGETIITVTTDDGKHTATCKVIVSDSVIPATKVTISQKIIS